MSGGVDSSLAAALLVRAGEDCVGVTFRMWPKTECGSSHRRACCNLESVVRARAVADDLGIPHYVFDLSADFAEEVIGYFCGEYLRGATPNPCIVCNERIKFGALVRKSLALNAARIATGHFAVVERSGAGRYLLKEGKDPAKDQSYFLSRLTQDQLARSVFPLGGFTKDRVRQLARRHTIRTHDAVSSQDICFVRDDHYAEYIRRRAGIEPKRGDIVDTAGTVRGRHNGLIYYTVGQRRGLGIAHTEPLYVVAIDIASNRLIVGQKGELRRKGVVVDRVNYIGIDGIDAPVNAGVKIRYNAQKAPATVATAGDGALRIDFAEPVDAPTPGQAAVAYAGDTVLLSGWIRESY